MFSFNTLLHMKSEFISSYTLIGGLPASHYCHIAMKALTKLLLPSYEQKQC